jgi:hypothetical protein
VTAGSNGSVHLSMAPSPARQAGPAGNPGSAKSGRTAKHETPGTEAGVVGLLALRVLRR